MNREPRTGTAAPSLPGRSHAGGYWHGFQLYRSEAHFARATSLLAVHRYEEARREVHTGLKHALRVSSTRNGLFLLGRITLAAGHSEEALRFFEAGATHPYQGQGGDGLLAWGDCLAELGRHDEAREAWRLVLTRDKQSGAASRLGLHGPVSGEGNAKVGT